MKIVTIEQKREFLRAQGWPSLENGRYPSALWCDPKTMIDMGGGKVHSVKYPTATAYGIAYRRKTDREARALRKAGYFRGFREDGRKGWRLAGIGPCLTHAEAVRHMLCRAHAAAALPAINTMARKRIVDKL